MGDFYPYDRILRDREGSHLMRKIFVGIILVFIIFSTMMILIREAPNQELRIKTLYSQYSRLITSQSETLMIPVFVSDEKTFLVDAQLIEYASLSTTNALIEVEVTNIIATDNYETYQNIDYRIYDFEMTFPMMESTDDFISLSDCRLSITYQNQDVIDLNIGDVFLRFSEVNDPGHIDLYRLYATTDMSSFEFVSGIVLGLTNLTSLELTLTSIDLGFDEINVDMQAMSYIESA
ncbi:MAG TPA: hypothetical protein PK113_05575, partial [Bacillota bacterium]|nr:hypothetical protein [Bacillota bacterium]